MDKEKSLEKLALALGEELRDKLVFHIAHREKDHVTLGAEGLRTLRFLVSEARRSHSKWIREHHKSEYYNEWGEILKFFDKVVERLIFAAKKVTVEVDWDKWGEIEKELNREIRKHGR